MCCGTRNEHTALSFPSGRYTASTGTAYGPFELLLDQLRHAAFGIIAAIDCKARLALTRPQSCRREVGQRLAGGFDNFAFEFSGVFLDEQTLFFIQRINVIKRAAQHRPAVRVRRAEYDLLRHEIELFPQRADVRW